MMSSTEFYFHCGAYKSHKTVRKDLFTFLVIVTYAHGKSTFDGKVWTYELTGKDKR